MTFAEWYTSKSRPFGTAYQILAEEAWNAATKAEREECAELCDDMHNKYEEGWLIGELIRARGER